MAGILLHLSAARGPGECRLAVEGLVRTLLSEAAALGLTAGLVEAARGSPGLMSAVVDLGGPGARDLARGWVGTVLWTCQSPLRPGHARRNWFVAVSEVEPAPAASPEVRPSDLRWETFRASGAGGQHVNTTDSAVRLRHLPSGLVVECREERSQHRNRALALRRLAAALAARDADGAGLAAKARRDRNVTVEGRGAAAVRAYEGPGFRRVR